MQLACDSASNWHVNKNTCFTIPELIHRQRFEMILPRFSLCTTMQRAESSKLLFEPRPGLWAMALISIAQLMIQALIQPLGETRRQDWRLCTKTTRSGLQPHLWSVDSSHVELAVLRRFCLEDRFFSIYQTC